jgi:hypothetical protein
LIVNLLLIRWAGARRTGRQNATMVTTFQRRFAAALVGESAGDIAISN